MIRAGTVEDFPEIVRMAREFWKHTIFDEPFCADSVEGMAAHCMDQGLFAVLEIKGKAAGFACGIKGGLLANVYVTTGTEVAYWVDPEHRRGRNGIALLKGLEDMAKEHGVKYWSMIFMQSSMPETVEQIYLKMGYNKSETSYTKVL